jgi:4'-phosphopantetheinyl transferase
MGAHPHPERGGIVVFLSTVDSRDGAGHERASARALAVRAASAVLGVRPDRVGLAHEPGGRPVLRGAAAELHVSISHGRRAVAVALTALAPVGVDVERLRPVDAVGLARRWFPAEEAAWLHALPPGQRERAFFWLWTHKEAVGKARGLGLREGGLRQPVPRRGDWTRPSSTMRPLAGDLAIAAPAAPDGVLLAVAAHGRAAHGAPVTVHDVAPHDRVDLD